MCFLGDDFYVCSYRVTTVVITSSIMLRGEVKYMRLFFFSVGGGLLHKPHYNQDIDPSLKSLQKLSALGITIAIQP